MQPQSDTPGDGTKLHGMEGVSGANPLSSRAFFERLSSIQVTNQVTAASRPCRLSVCIVLTEHAVHDARAVPGGGNDHVSVHGLGDVGGRGRRCAVASPALTWPGPMPRRSSGVSSVSGVTPQNYSPGSWAAGPSIPLSAHSEPERADGRSACGLGGRPKALLPGTLCCFAR